MLDENYAKSFARNLGILSQAEQQTLADTTVAVAGLGGVGGNVLILLARMGVGRFRIADFDCFEWVNINRQYGASIETIGQHKADVLTAEVRAINPAAMVTVFPQGFTDELGDDLLDGVNVAVDAIDFYAIDAHLAFHRRTRTQGLYTLMGSAVGFSACLQVFDPNGMGIEEYCDIRPDMTRLEKQLRYACSIVPELLHIDYFDVSRDASNTDFLTNTGPSLSVACSLAASLVAAECALIVLKRRPPKVIPYTFQFDPYTYRYARTYVEGGMRNFDPSPVIRKLSDKSSFVPRVLERLYLNKKVTRALVNGAELFYKAEGTGHPLLLISPLGADSSFWLRQISDFTRHFKVITFGNRGTSESSPAAEDCSTELLAEDAIALLDYLNIDSTHILGLALGGLIAQHMALRRPGLVNRLVLVSSYMNADDEIQGTTAGWRQVAVQQGMDDLFDICLAWLFSREYLADNSGEVDKLRTVYRLTHQDPVSFCGQSLAGVRHDSRDWVSRIARSTLVVHGEQDRLVSPNHGAALARTLPNARLALLDNAPHFLTWEAATRFNDEVIRFLKTD